jgi:hypothetical protein
LSTRRDSQVASVDSPRKRAMPRVDGDVHLLQRLFRFSVVAQRGAREPVQAPVVAPHQQIECRPVTVCDEVGDRQVSEG